MNDSHCACYTSFVKYTSGTYVELYKAKNTIKRNYLTGYVTTDQVNNVMYMEDIAYNLKKLLKFTIKKATSNTLNP